MKQVTSETLKRTMADDPWFQTLLDPKTLDTQGLSPEFKPTLVETEEERAFEHAVEAKPTTYADIFKAAQTDRELVRDWANQTGKTRAERDALFKANDP